jgi:mRNA-degrading endonuclease RelE of RelBE toxin-antitoxin system
MRMWEIREHRHISKSLRRLPPWIAKEYEVWKDLVHRHGPEILRQYPGYHDEFLKGERAGQRSSRLSRQYRVIYAVDREIVVVYVLEITPHKY